MFTRLMILLSMIAVGFFLYLQSYAWAAVTFCGFQASCTYLIVETIMAGRKKNAN